jgi:hypothetical protein
MHIVMRVRGGGEADMHMVMLASVMSFHTIMTMITIQLIGR